MVSRYGHYEGRLGVAFDKGQGKSVRVPRPQDVVFRRRVGIDLIAAHHDERASWQFVTVDLQAGLSEQIGNRIGRVEAVSKVGDVVEPDRRLWIVGTQVCSAQLIDVRFGIKCCVDQPSVRVLAEDLTDDDRP